ncbi:MAG TPA: hypothetical protein VMW25_03670 [Clostridia bacterium]|nr:hypothetical protein [Clostridia bacterium]
MKKQKFLIIILSTLFLILAAKAWAVSPTPTSTATPTLADEEDEKVQEIRDKVKEKVNEIKEKIEKKAYVGQVTQITDSTLVLDNFRGKQRVRLTEETSIIGTNKKQIKIKDLVVGDKVISMGTVSENEILEASRVVAVLQPQNPPAKRIVFMGTVAEVDSKKSELTLRTVKNQEESLSLKVDAKTKIVQEPENKDLSFKDLQKEQKVIVIYPEPAEGKTPLAKQISILS